MNTFLPHLARLLELAAMQDKGTLGSLREVAKTLKVSHMTVMRDLELLPEFREMLEKYNKETK